MGKELIKQEGGHIDSDGRLILSEEVLSKIEGFGAIYWTTDEIAEYFGITDLRWWKLVTSDPSSLVSRAISHGALEQRARIELGILMSAQQGDSEAIKDYKELMRDKSFTVSKLDLFGGPRDVAAWEQLQQYISSGSKGKLSSKERQYIDLLTLIYSLDGQYGKRNVIKFLTSEPFCFTYDQASRLYAESTEMFYCNRRISREALRAKTADQLDTLYIAAWKAAKTTKDYECAANILAQKAQLLHLDEDDVKKLSPESYDRKPTVLSLNAGDIGLQTADRRKLAVMIDSLEIPASEKSRIEMEAGIKDVDIVKILENESQEADQH